MADDVLRLTTAATIAEVSRVRWKPLAARAQLYQSYDWLRWAEDYYDLPQTYVLAEDASGALAGAVVTYLMTTVPTRLTTWYDPIRMFLTPHCDPTGAADRWFPVLLVGGCSGYHSEVLLAPGLDERRRDAVTRAILAGCREVAAEQGARTLAFMYASRPVADGVAGVWGDGSRVIATSAEAVIPLDRGERSLNDYLARFPSARRSKLRKEVTAFEASGARLARYRLGDVLDDIGPLLGAHQRKFGDPVTDQQMGQYLALQEKHLGDGSVVFVDERDGRINGFTLCYAHGDTLYSRAAGFDAAGAAPFSYFNLAVYAPVRHAVAHGYTAVALGAGSYQGKVLRGAEVRGLWSVLVPPTPLDAAWAAVLGQPSPQAVEAGCA